MRHIKRLRNSSIKDEQRRELNKRLRKVSDDCIDLMEQMLHKDPVKRIEMIEIFEHPWIQKYKKRAEHWSDDDEESTPSESLEQENDTESIDS